MPQYDPPEADRLETQLEGGHEPPEPDNVNLDLQFALERNSISFTQTIQAENDRDPQFTRITTGYLSVFVENGRRALLERALTHWHGASELSAVQARLPLNFTSTYGYTDKRIADYTHYNRFYTQTGFSEGNALYYAHPHHQVGYIELDSNTLQYKTPTFGIPEITLDNPRIADYNRQITSFMQNIWTGLDMWYTPLAEMFMSQIDHNQGRDLWFNRYPTHFIDSLVTDSNSLYTQDAWTYSNSIVADGEVLHLRYPNSYLDVLRANHLRELYLVRSLANYTDELFTNSENWYLPEPRMFVDTVEADVGRDLWFTRLSEHNLSFLFVDADQTHLRYVDWYTGKIPFNLYLPHYRFPVFYTENVGFEDQTEYSAHRFQQYWTDQIDAETEYWYKAEPRMYTSPLWTARDRQVSLVRQISQYISSIYERSEVLQYRKPNTFVDNLELDVKAPQYRTPRFYHGISETDSKRIASYNRDISTFTEIVWLDSDRTVPRISTNYSTPLIADSQSFSLYNRSLTNFVETIEAVAEREQSLVRAINTYTENLMFVSEVWYYFDPNFYTDPIMFGTNRETEVWTANGKMLRDITEEIREWQLLTLAFRMPKDEVLNRFRPVVQEAGKLDTITNTDGGFDTVDRVGGGNTINLIPPGSRDDLRTVTTWHIDDYTEELVDSRGRAYDVELNAIPTKEKTYDNEYGNLDERVSTESGEGEWYFEFRRGDISTATVNPDVSKSPNGAIEEVELSMTLTKEETKIIEESASLLEAVQTRNVPDGQNVSIDNSSDERNTVEVFAPSDEAEKTIPSGDYVVSSWQTTWKRGGVFGVEVVLKGT